MKTFAIEAAKSAGSGAASASPLRTALLIGAAAIPATLALFPYVLALLPQALDKLPVAPAVVIAAQTLQTGVLCFLLAWAGLKLGAPLGLGAPWLAAWCAGGEKPASSGWRSAATLGLLGGLLTLGLIAVFGQPFSPPTPPPDAVSFAWRGALASFYGGIVEETILRLFLMALLARLLMRAGLRRPLAIGIAIAAAALLFGAGHLPAAAALGPLDAAMVARVIGYNALLGLGFGWLFCKRGIEHAMLAHFCADIVLHVLAPLMDMLQNQANA